MMKHKSAVICICMLLAAVISAADESVPIVKEIQIEKRGGVEIDEQFRSFVKAHIKAKQGETLDRNVISDDLRTLLDTKRFADAHISVESADYGVILIYTLENKLKLGVPVVIHGAKKFSLRTVENELNLSCGDLVDDQTMGARTSKLAGKYRKSGYYDVKFSWKIAETEPGTELATVTLNIDEGKRNKVSGANFRGNDSLADKILRKPLRQYGRWDPRRIFRKRSYEADELDIARGAIRDAYLQRGYLDVEVSIPELTVNDTGAFVVNVDICEGIRYKFRKITIEGTTLFPVAELERCVSAVSGTYADANAIARSCNALMQYYGDRGYIDTYVNPVLNPDRDNGFVDVAFVVSEGELVTIRNIMIRGNTRTMDRVVRRELLVYPGDEYHETRVRRSEKIVSNLGYFSSVRSHPERTENTDERDLIFDVEEKRTGQFMLGAGFSSVDKMVGFVELSQGNFDITGWPFTGAGQKLKLRGQFGSTRKDYELSFTEPWFMGRKLALGCELYMSDVTYSDYEMERVGGAVSIRKALPFASYIKMVYRLERVGEIAETNKYVFLDNPGEEVDFFDEDSAVKSSLAFTLTRDARDNPFFPTRGCTVSLFGHVSGGILGFDTDIYGLGAKIARYIPLWFGHVLSLKARYEIVEEYGDTEEVPLADRLFVGGGRTIRGFDYRDVGPKARCEPDDGKYRATGGKSLALGNVEYTVPIVSGIRMAAFYDIGNVWLESYTMHSDNLASSGGVGIRFDLPGFPIRIDRAWVIESDDGITDEDAWVLWIGYDF
ncbi:MAG: outer membrane protein assembly factor BamA [Lentisphaerae bacterium]|nr:outer membrane protein assembly factor BamA [Lentisphaerota bacterium]